MIHRSTVSALAALPSRNVSIEKCLFVNKLAPRQIEPPTCVFFNLVVIHFLSSIKHIHINLTTVTLAADRAPKPGPQAVGVDDMTYMICQTRDTPWTSHVARIDDSWIGGAQLYQNNPVNKEYIFTIKLFTV